MRPERVRYSVTTIEPGASEVFTHDGTLSPFSTAFLASRPAATSTNTSNPSVLGAAGRLGQKAVDKGLKVPSLVKSSLAPGSMVVTEYLTRSGLMPYLEKLKFNLVGYGCTTCIGNSGPLPQEV